MSTASADNRGRAPIYVACDEHKIRTHVRRGDDVKRVSVDPAETEFPLLSALLHHHCFCRMELLCRCIVTFAWRVY